MTLVELIKKIAKQLSKYNIPYMIIGGQAALLYSEPRFTNDIDITLGVDSDKLKDLLKIVSEINLMSLVLDVETHVLQTMVLPLIEISSGNRVDLIFSFTQFERDAIERANRIKIDDVEVCYCSVEDLIILKIFAGRERDLEDVRQILLKNKNINKVLISSVLTDLGIEVGRDLIRIFNKIEEIILLR